MGLFGSKINVARTRQEIAEAEAENARAEGYLAEERRDKEKVESELDYQRRIDEKEKKDLKAADKKINRIVLSGTNEINDLIKISMILKDLAGVRDEGKALQLKEAYQRQLAALSSIMQPRQLAINELKRVVEEVRTLDHSEVSLDTNIDNMIRAIERLAQKGGMPLEAKKLASIRQLASKGVSIAQQKQQDIERLEKEFDYAIKTEISVTNIIQRIITDIHNNDFPSAYLEINNCIIAARKNEKLCIDTKALFARIRSALDQRLSEFTQEFKKLKK